jgi:uncharacterized membrane protein YphA (DoxX/SURF4 family)
MVVLVALRIAVGWHFFKEGLAHRADPNWTSEGFLKQAKGPLAANFQAVLPKFHNWDRLILVPLPDANPAAKDESEDEAAEKSAKSNKKPTTVYDDWLDQVKADWKTELGTYSDFHKLSDEQKTQAAEIQKQSLKQLEDYLKDNTTDIRLYRELAYRAQMMQAVPGGGEIPFIKNRAAAVEKNPTNEVGLAGTAAVISSPPPAWEAGAKGIEQLYHMRLDDLLSPDQHKLGDLPADTAKLHKINQLVIWGLIGVGACLVVGLFTRLAALAGALFLLSIICTQPPWAAGTVDTYNQVVEMLALLVLATTTVGRWGGLDYFVHLLVKPFTRRKEAA